MSETSAPSAVHPASQFHIVRFKDLPGLKSQQDQILELLPLDRLEVMTQFPGAFDEFPVFFYLTIAGEICSYMRLIPDQLTVDGQAYRWAWSGDNFTYPQYRGLGLSTLLQRQATEYLHQQDIGRGSVASTEVSLHIFAKLGFTLPGYLRRFLLLRSAAPLLNAHLKARPFLATAANLLARPLMGAAMLPLRFWNCLLRHGTRCQPLDDFSSPQLQKLLSRISAFRPVHFAMQPELLQRKFEMAKCAGTMSVWLLSDSKTGDSLAYMIVRERFQNQPLAEKYHDFQLMSLMDFGFLPGDARAAAAVMGHLLKLFFHGHCQVLEVASNNTILQQAARRRGLLSVGKGMSFAFSIPLSWNCAWDAANLESWPLTNFCGDAFTF